MCTQWCSRLLHYHFTSTPHIQVWYTDRYKGNIIIGKIFLTLFSHSFGNIDCLFFLQTRWKGHRYVYKWNVSIKIFNELMLWYEIPLLFCQFIQYCVFFEYRKIFYFVLLESHNSKLFQQFGKRLHTCLNLSLFFRYRWLRQLCLVFLTVFYILICFSYC